MTDGRPLASASIQGNEHIHHAPPFPAVVVSFLETTEGFFFHLSFFGNNSWE